MVSEKKHGFLLWKGLDPPLRYMYICTLSYSVVCEDGTTISVVDGVNFSVLVNKCVRPSCSLGGSTYPPKICIIFFSMRLGFVVSRYLLGTLGDSHYFL